VLSTLQERAIKAPLKSRTKRDVIAELVSVLADLSLISDKDLALNDVLKREYEQSTGLEKGVAVPHAKTHGVSDLVMAVGISPQGVDFGAFDGQPSRIFFLILCPPDRPDKHIKALEEIAFLVSNEDFLNSVLKKSDSSAVLSELKKYERKA